MLFLNYYFAKKKKKKLFKPILYALKSTVVNVTVSHHFHICDC
jgi:hypothetical protein